LFGEPKILKNSFTKKRLVGSFHFNLNLLDLHEIIEHMLSIIIGSGANLFIIIVAILAGIGAGLTTTDYLKTKAKEKKWEEAEESNSDSSDSL